MKIVPPLNPNTFVVSYRKRWGLQGRKPVYLYFNEDRDRAIKAALRFVVMGYKEVTVIHKRETLYSHARLKSALLPHWEDMVAKGYPCFI